MLGTVLITGGSSGIGLCAVRELSQSASKPKVVVANRTPPPPSLPSNVVYEKLDLASGASVRTLVESWSHGRISALICNAGMFPGGGPPKYTPEGVELTIAVNHLNHALLFFLLKEHNLLEPDCKIVLVTSAVHDPKAPLAPAAPYWLGPDGMAEAKHPKLAPPMVRYANSKLEVILFAYALNRRIKESGKGWTVLAFEPGFTPGRGSRLGREAPSGFHFVESHILPRLLWIFRLGGTVTSSPPVSGKAMAKLVLSDEYTGVTGKYILLHNERPSSVDSYDTSKQDELWNWTIQTLTKDGKNGEVLHPF